MPEYDEAEMGKAISASILENSRGVDVGADALHDHLQSHQIAATLQDDDVGKFAAWLHILLVPGLYRGEVLGDNRLERPAPFLHIPQSTAEDADVGIRLHKDLNVKHIPESGVLENQDALYDDNLGGEDFPGLLRAVVLHIRVDRAADGAALFQLLQMLDEQLCIKGGGVVIIYLGPFFQSLAVLTLIVIVMADDGDFRAEMLFQMPGEGGFAGAGTAGDTDQDGTNEEPPISYKVAGTWGAYW